MTKNFVIASTAVTNQNATVVITDTKLYAHVVTLLTQDNTKLLQKLKSGFKRPINWYKYQSKVSIEAQDPYLDFQINPNFQRVNRLLFCCLKRMHIKQVKSIFSSNCRNKRLQCSD